MRALWTQPDPIFDIDPDHPWAGDVEVAIMPMPLHGTQVWDSSPHRRHAVAGSGITFSNAGPFGRCLVFDGTSNGAVTWSGLDHGTICPKEYTALMLLGTADVSADWWHTGAGNRMLWRYSSSKLNVYSNLALEAAATISLPPIASCYALTHEANNTTIFMFEDGTELSSTGSTSVVYATGTVGMALGYSTASARGLAANVYQFTLLSRVLRRNEIAEWVSDPWAMYRPQPREFGFVPAAPPGSTVPALDEGMLVGGLQPLAGGLA